MATLPSCGDYPQTAENFLVGGGYDTSAHTGSSFSNLGHGAFAGDVTVDGTGEFGDVTVGDDLTVTGVIYASAGTAALPSIAFAGDVHNGFYLYGADSIGVAIAGGAAAYWNSAKKLFQLGAFDVAGVANFQGIVTLASTHIVLPLGTSSPAVTTQGAAYFNTADSKIYVYNGGWIATAALTA
jgi:hypothetical protein